MKGSEEMIGESDAWSSTLQNVVEDHLKSAGVQILSAAYPLASGASDDELHQFLLEVEDKYHSEATQIDRDFKESSQALHPWATGSRSSPAPRNPMCWSSWRAKAASLPAEGKPLVC